MDTAHIVATWKRIEAATPSISTNRLFRAVQTECHVSYAEVLQALERELATTLKAYEAARNEFSRQCALHGKSKPDC